LEWIRKSARQGNFVAQISLGGLLKHKDVEPELRNPVEAYAWLVAAGDELLGLGRGLFRAGAASLLVALWEVPDKSTAELMSAFYDRMPAAPNRAIALRDAMLEVRERYPHPLHWAPFFLSGKILSN